MLNALVENNYCDFYKITTSEAWLREVRAMKIILDTTLSKNYKSTLNVTYGIRCRMCHIYLFWRLLTFFLFKTEKWITNTDKCARINAIQKIK